MSRQCLVESFVNGPTGVLTLRSMCEWLGQELRQFLAQHS